MYDIPLTANLDTQSASPPKLTTGKDTVITVVVLLVILLMVVPILLVLARLTWRKRYSNYTFILILNSDFVYYHRKSGNTIIHVSDCCNPLDSILTVCYNIHIILNSNKI